MEPPKTPETTGAKSTRKKTTRKKTTPPTTTGAKSTRTKPLQVYGGRYAVVEHIGTGGMAEVYRARDEVLSRVVALKVLSKSFTEDHSFLERFRREAQLAAKLNHPNIAGLYDFGADKDSYYMVMEFIDGASLSEVLRRDGPPTPEKAVEIASDVAEALERAHASGLVHRHIKSSNIMLTRSGRTKVMNFGFAVAPEETVFGTAYLSPEQAQGKRTDARSDVYSLGVVLYEMLTGQTPFTGDTPMSVAYKHVRENPRVPSSVNPEVPATLDAVTLRALAKDPDNRYQSAAEMRRDLERLLGNNEVRRAGRPGRPSSFRRHS